MLDYGMIGNGRTAALVSLGGSVDWLCLPAFDGPSVFARVLDPDGGCFSIEPAGGAKRIRQAYIRNTNVLETTVESASGCYRLTDFMPRGQARIEETSYAHCQIVRRLSVISGAPEIKVRFEPRPDYGRAMCACTQDGPHRIRAAGAAQTLYLDTSLPADAIGSGEAIRLDGDAAFLLSTDRPHADPAQALREADQLLAMTVGYWRDWLKQCHLPGRYQDEIIRSALTLKMMVYERTGAIVAAPTAALPEEPGGVRNWDYRYCWLRDSLFTVGVLYELSLFREKEAYIDFIRRVTRHDGDHLPPLFTVEGDTVPPETHLSHWRGFAGSRPIRIGNNARDHYQHDVYGEVMLALFQYAKDRRFVDVDYGEVWRITCRMAELACRHFGGKDAGPWEFNERLDHYTFSKVMCWVAVDRAAKIARQLGHEDRARGWEAAGDRMRGEILERAWNDKLRAYTQAYGSDCLDATTLLLPIVGFVNARDPRMRATVERTEQLLTRDGFVFRYDHEDDFGRPANAFLICSFWLIDNWVLAGELDRGKALFERLLRHGNHLGLYSEHIQPGDGRLVGNFPQSYTHVAVVFTAMLLSSYEALEKGVGYFDEL